MGFLVILIPILYISIGLLVTFRLIRAGSFWVDSGTDVICCTLFYPFMGLVVGLPALGKLFLDWVRDLPR